MELVSKFSLSPVADGEKPAGKRTLNIEKIISGRPFFCSFLITVVLFSTIFSFFKSYFQLVDDVYVLLLLKGQGLSNTGCEFNLLQNPILSIVLKHLYQRLPSVEWYSSFLIFSLMFGTWGILAALQLGTNALFKSALFILGSFILEIQFAAAIQWTVVASVAGMGGLLLIAAVWRRENSEFLKPALGLAFVLVMISVLIRTDAFMLMVLVSIPMFAFLFWKVKFAPARQKIAKSLMVISAFALAVIFLGWVYYCQNPEWKKASEFLDHYGHLNVLRNPVYNENTEPVFKSIGWSPNDLDLFKNLYFMDSDTYSFEKIDLLQKFFPRFTFDKNPNETFVRMFSNPGTHILLSFLLVVFWFMEIEVFSFVVLNLVFTGFILLFCRLYLWMPPRIYIPCLFYQNAIFVFFSFGQNRVMDLKKAAVKWGIAFGVLFLAFSLFVAHLGYEGNQYSRYLETQLKKQMKDLAPREDQLFVTWASSYPYENIAAFDNGEIFQNFNVLPIDWFQRTPITTAMLNRFSLKNLFRDLMDNPKVFLICSPRQWTLYQTYMREKYNQSVRFEVYFHSDQFNVLSVRSH